MCGTSDLTAAVMRCEVRQAIPTYVIIISEPREFYATLQLHSK